MKKATLAALLLLTCLTATSCGTTHGVRWTYGASSMYDEPDDFSESYAIRAALGIPVIAGGLVFDATTFPLQAIFGVWPWWGSASNQMKPSGS